MALYLDCETFSSIDIKDGVYRYVEAPDFEVMLIAYAIDDGPVVVRDLWEPKTAVQDFLDAYANDAIVAHNAQFDRVALTKPSILPAPPPIEHWRCTMAQAYAHGLPGSLSALGEVLGLPQDQRKLQAGRDLVNLFCKPLGKNRKLDRATKHTHPAEWAQFVEYARQDVIALREIHKRIPAWNYTGIELDLWHLDQYINDYGMLLDVELIDSIVKHAASAKDALDASMQEATAGCVDTANERDRLLAFLNSVFGLGLKNLRSGTVERAFERSDLPPDVVNILRLRLLSAKSSVSKYKRARSAVCEDGRVRGTLQWCGASRTGRYAGRIVQPQNFPRPTVSNELIGTYREAFKDGSISVLTDNTLQAAADCTRSMIIAPPGKKLLVGDYSNIEGRVLAWLAGEDWKIEAFRDFDRGEGADVYCLAYAKAFGKSAESVTGDERQIGKTMELAFGYGGGVGSLASMAEIYGISLDAIAETVLPVVDRAVLDGAYEFRDWAFIQGRDYGMPRDQFIACDCLKRLWRAAHPATCAFWDDCEYCFKSGSGQLLHVAFDRVKAWTRIRLPSGRYLSYSSVRLKDGKLSFMGVDQKTRRWSRVDTYGAKIVENITQAAARDILLYHFPRIQSDVGQIILTVHDENVVESDIDKTPADLEKAMLAPLNWAEGLPLAVKAFECNFYQKG